MDREIIPVITMLANMVHNRIAIAMVIINGNSTDRVMAMHIANGAAIAAVATTNILVSYSCDLFLLRFRSC